MGAVLVTGATGTVGSSVVSDLLAMGEPVRAAVRDLHTTLPDGATPVWFDFGEPSSWAAAFDGVDRLFLVRPPEISDVKTSIRPVVRMAADRELRQVVFLSVMGVNRLLPHWLVERDVEDADLPHTFLRPAFFAQNLATAYRHDIADRDRIRLASGRGRTSFVDTRDVAAVAAIALRECADHAGRAYTLTGPAALTYQEVAAMLTAQLGRPIQYQPIGLLRYRRELLGLGLDRGYANVQLVINAVAALGLADNVTAEVRTVLERDPIPLDRFIKDYEQVWQPTSITG